MLEMVFKRCYNVNSYNGKSYKCKSEVKVPSKWFRDGQRQVRLCMVSYIQQ